MMSDDKTHISALKNQGISLMNSNRLNEAKALFTQLCITNPDDAEAWYVLSSINGMLGNIDEAGDCCRKVIALQPQIAMAHCNLGNVYTIQGRLDEAQSCYRETLRLDPRNALAHCNLGNLLQTTGQVDEAITCFHKALSLNPNLVEALINLGNIFFEQARLDEASACLKKALQLMPGSVQAHNTLGNVYARRGMLDEAMASYREALRLDPRNASTYSNLGNLLKTLGRAEEAAAQFQKALQLNPGLAEAHVGLGNIFFDQNRNEEALACYQEALRLRPGLPQVYNNLGGIYTREGKLNEALASYREALHLDPGNAQAHSNYLFAMTYHEDYDAATVFAEHVRWGELHGRAPAEIMAHDNVPDKDRRLRLGYVSGDFRNHPVGIFIEQVLANHDKARFEIFCYSNYAISDDLTERLRRHAHHWRDVVGQTDETVAQQIRQDRIDILVDLAGHTAENRLLTFALKPAPVQATWMSYIATTGLKTIDYIIGNRFIIPPQDECYYVEKVVRLPRSFLCFTPPRFPIEVSPLPALSRKGVTFGCFNNTAKLTPAVIAVWAKLLLALPHSRLFLKSGSFGDEPVRKHYQDLFAAHGVGAEQLQFAGRSPRDEYLAAYQEVDIGLDPFPYNGGTTTVEAVWMGVPVVTLRGDRFVSRMGESIMMNLGLEECVADSKEAYIAEVLALASDLPRLAALRARLRGQLLNSPLCDGPGFTRDLEAAYRTMWEAWCQAQKKSHA